MGWGGGGGQEIGPGEPGDERPGQPRGLGLPGVAQMRVVTAAAACDCCLGRALHLNTTTSRAHPAPAPCAQRLPSPEAYLELCSTALEVACAF